MVTDGEKWKYLSFLLRELNSANNDYFYWLSCLHSFKSENKLKLHENVCRNHDYCYVEILIKT